MSAPSTTGDSAGFMANHDTENMIQPIISVGMNLSISVILNK